MRGLALGLLIAYGLVAFVFRVLVQLRLTGSTGLKGISGRPGSVEWLSGVLFVASIAVSVAGVASGGTDGPPVIGPVLAVGGLLATAGAQLAMGEAWRIGVDPGERTALVTGGPF